jgi:hypothetical protein
MIRDVVAGSSVPEDPQHAENTLEWLLRLAQRADPALRIAALAHDIDRAVEGRKVRRAGFGDYDAFKAAHARNGARILGEILEACRVPREIAQEACRLVRHHEFGGDPRSDLVREADAISFFDVNLPLYRAREGLEAARRRSAWGYRRLSSRTRRACELPTYPDPRLTDLIREVIRRSAPRGSRSGLSPRAPSN